MSFVDNWIDRLVACETVFRLERVFLIACDKCALMGISIQCDSCPIESAYRIHLDALHFAIQVEKDLGSYTPQVPSKPIGFEVYTKEMDERIVLSFRPKKKR